MQFLTNRVLVGAGREAVLLSKAADLVVALTGTEYDYPRWNVVRLAVEDGCPDAEAWIIESSLCVQRHVEAGRTVAVHCDQGVSRTAAIAVGYLYLAGFDLPQALMWLGRVYPAGVPHANFSKALWHVAGANAGTVERGEVDDLCLAFQVARRTLDPWWRQLLVVMEDLEGYWSLHSGQVPAPSLTQVGWADGRGWTPAGLRARDWIWGRDRLPVPDGFAAL